MFNLSDVVGMMINGGMSNSSSNRLNHALQSGGSTEEATGKSTGGGLGSIVAGLTGRGSGGGGLGDLLGNLIGGSGSAGGGLKNLGGMLSGILGQAGQALGGKKNLAIGGLGALAGAVLGGGKSAMKGSLGTGAMALLGAMAFDALKKSRTAPEPGVPLGLREPESDRERDELENNAGLVAKAMISAAKSDGQIDQQEIHRILGKLQAEGLDEEAQQYLMAEMQQPLDLEALCAAATGQQELAAEMYAASLMAIEVDTPAEQDYMERLAHGLGLTPGTVQRLKTMVGMQQ